MKRTLPVEEQVDSSSRKAASAEYDTSVGEIRVRIRCKACASAPAALNNADRHTKRLLRPQTPFPFAADTRQLLGSQAANQTIQFPFAADTSAPNDLCDAEQYTKQLLRSQTANQTPLFPFAAEVYVPRIRPLHCRGNFLNGYGEILYSDGTVYLGGWYQGSFSGLGTMFSPDGTVYYGEWLQGRRHGCAWVSYPEGLHKLTFWSNNKLKRDLAMFYSVQPSA